MILHFFAADSSVIRLFAKARGGSVPNNGNLPGRNRSLAPGPFVPVGWVGAQPRGLRSSKFRLSNNSHSTSLNYSHILQVIEVQKRKGSPFVVACKWSIKFVVKIAAVSK